LTRFFLFQKCDSKLFEIVPFGKEKDDSKRIGFKDLGSPFRDRRRQSRYSELKYHFGPIYLFEIALLEKKKTIQKESVLKTWIPLQGSPQAIPILYPTKGFRVNGVPFVTLQLFIVICFHTFF
jgi:hypothetical protein